MKNLFLFFYAIIPLSAYQFFIGGIGVSLDRVLFPLVLVSGLLMKFDKIQGLVPVVLLLFLSSFLSILFSNEYNWLGFYNFGPSWFQSLFVFAISVIVAAKFGDLWISRILSLHLLCLFFFACYGFWYRYILDEVNVVYPLSSFLPDLIENKHKWTQLYHKRLFFPFSSAPRLGFVAGFLAIFFNFFYERRIRLLWVGASLFVVIVTISRGPIVSLLFAIFVAAMLKNLYKGRLFSLFSIMLLILGLFEFYSLTDLSEYSKFGRLFTLGADDESTQGHIGIRLRVLDLVFNSSFVNLIFGFGLGQIEAHLDVSSAHSSYFTQLYEQGLLGALSLILVYILIIRNAGLLYILQPSRRTFGLFVLALYLMLVHFTYDAISMVILWGYNGFVWGLVINKKKIEYKHSSPVLQR
jgi:hypothetical protein